MLIAVAIVALVALAGSAQASAATLNVCESGCTYSTIQDAVNAAQSGDTISIAAGGYAGFTVPGGNTNGLTSVTLTGAGAGQTTVTPASDGAIVVFIQPGVSVNLSGVTITGAELGPNSPFTGGGVANQGTLTLSNSTVSNNAGHEAAGIANQGTMTLNNSTVTGNTSASDGGGISNDGTMTINNSTVSNNKAVGNNTLGGLGGGISNLGTMTVNNSTVSGNSATATNGDGDGGGIVNWGAGAATLNDSTVTNNTASDQGGGISNGTSVIPDSGGLTLNSSTVSNNSAGSGAGGGIFGAGDVTAKATIVSGNTAGGASSNCDVAVASSSSSLEGPAGATSCGFTNPSDLTSADPMLGPLADNGGPTQTQALLSGSPAIDAIPDTGCPTSTDQRGLPRPDGLETVCDVGAYETQDAPADLKITVTASPNPAVSGQPLTYTIVATNTGGQTATAVTVTDALPATAQFDSMSATQGTCTRTASGTPKTKGGTVTCQLGDLTAGKTATLTIAVRPTKPGALSDNASVTATNVSPADADDSATSTTTAIGS